MRYLLAASMLVASFAMPARAQYVFDPSNADEQGPGIKYFGSAKDERGALLPGVTIVIAGAFTLVTDAQGRYRGLVDDIFIGDKTPIGCSKPGYSFVKVNRRAGPSGGARQTYEADCVLRKNP